MKRWLHDHDKVRLKFRWAIVHTAFLFLFVDFIAYIIPELGHLVEPAHEILYRSGGVLAVVVAYVES